MRFAPLALLLVLSLGCTTWRPVALPTPQDSTWSTTGNLRYTTSDGRRVTATAATLAGDSLRLTGAQGATLATIPRDQGAGLQRQGVSGGRTAALLLVVLAGVAVVIAAAGSSLGGIGGGGYGY